MTKTNRRNTDRQILEALETRQLLSAAVAAVAHPDSVFTPAAAGSFAGYSPSQIAKAYGYDKISFGNGVAADGSGQTIAIVDAFNDPNIVADLKVFDAKFGLPNLDANGFKVVSQTGGSTRSVSNDSGWSSEIALDVEWAHAIAPRANILLVEALSDSFTDLNAAVNYARNAAGVSVVSMSWGGSEFRGQTAYDATFATPKHHAGVTFVASSGDDGGQFGAEWPASSPSVLAVGGTVLHADSSGTYQNEIAWNYSTGGVSRFETEPKYQSGVQSTGRRTSPDVAYNASVITGFQVYSSVNDQGTVGWSNVGGTSAGAPQWAALIAIANQGRALQGKAALDGASMTLPSLYSLYASPTSAKYAAYTADFHDISSGAVVQSVTAATGYDRATGLGSPMADKVVAALMNAAAPAVKRTVSGKTRAASTAAAAVSAAHRFIGVRDSQAAAEAVPTVNPDTYSVGLIRRTGFTGFVAGNETAVAVASVAPSAVKSGQVQGVYSTTLASAAGVTSNGQSVEWGSGVELHAAESAPTDAPVAESNQGQVMVNLEQPALDGAGPVVHSSPLFDFSHPQAATAFADSMSAFVHDSTALATSVIPTSSRGRAWAITGAVVTLDAVLVGSWIANRKESRRSKKRQADSPFSVENLRW